MHLSLQAVFWWMPFLNILWLLYSSTYDVETAGFLLMGQ